MRRRIFLFVLPGVVCCAAAWIWFMGHHVPSALPKAKIVLLGYTNITLTDPDTNVFVYPSRGRWLQARMKLTNEGTTSFSYSVWLDELYGWAKVQTLKGATNGYLAPGFTGGTAVLAPGSNATFSVYLPVDTETWECGIPVETSSLRERAIFGIVHNTMWRGFYWLCDLGLRMLPDKRGPEVELRSGLIEVGSHTNDVQKSR